MRGHRTWPASFDPGHPYVPRLYKKLCPGDCFFSIVNTLSTARGRTGRGEWTWGKPWETGRPILPPLGPGELEQFLLIGEDV